MVRRIAREIALQALFQLDFTGWEGDVAAAVSAAAGEHEAKYALKAVDYATILVTGVQTNREALDGQITAASNGWSLERMGVTDRNILRLAVYEIRHDVDVSVAINEAVELAKIYCDDRAPKFINGVLGAVVKA